MTSLRRLLKQKFLTEYLEAACDAFETPFAAAVLSGDRLLATAGRCDGELRPEAPGVVALPLKVAGKTAGQLLLRNCATDGADQGAVSR